jgi:hypothetical protein
MFQNSEAEGGAKDNVIGAICRVIQFHKPESTPDLVNFVAQNIPFNEDGNENETVLKAFFTLYQSNPELVKPHF